MVATRRPSWSLAWATWTSRWVSTPTVIWGRGAPVCAMLVMAVSSPWRGWWMARAPAGRTALRGVWATGSYQVTFVRLACQWWSRLEPTGQIQGTKPVDERVRPSPRPHRWNAWWSRLEPTGRMQGTEPVGVWVRPSPSPPRDRSSQRVSGRVVGCRRRVAAGHGAALWRHAARFLFRPCREPSEAAVGVMARRRRRKCAIQVPNVQPPSSQGASAMSLGRCVVLPLVYERAIGRRATHPGRLRSRRGVASCRCPTP